MAYDLNLGHGNVARMEPELYEVDASLHEGPEPAECELCGERGPDAEMYNPRQPEAAAQLVHAECGLQAGMEVA